MKKTKKILKASLAVALIFGSVGALAGCNKDNETVEKTEQEKVYDLYVAYMSAKGETPQTYEQWLVTIKGQKGDKGDKGDTGETGQAGATWYTGEGTPADAEVTGKEGDLYLDTDTSNVYKKGATAWELLTNIKGGKGDTGTTGATGGTGATGQTGATGNGISDFDVVYEYDDEGKLWAVFTITYTEGDPQVIRTVMPKRIMQLESLSLKDGETINKFAKLSSNDDAPELYMRVIFDDYSYGYVKTNSDMFEEAIDFTIAETQSYFISYFGKYLSGQIDIVDLTTLENETPTYVDLVDQSVATDETLKDVLVKIVYGDSQLDPENVKEIFAPLSVVAENYTSTSTNESSSTIDLTVVDKYYVSLKETFAYEEYEEPRTLYLMVYNPAETTINHFQINDVITVELGATNYEETIKNTDVEVWLHEPTEDGKYSLDLKIKDMNYDLSAFDVDRVGEQAIPVSYKIEGQSKAYEDVIWVTVEADLEEATLEATYTVDPNEASTTMMMFSMMYGGQIKLYDNGVATSEQDYGYGVVVTQYSYELADEGQTLKIYDSMMNGYAYYSLDTTNNYVKFYTPAAGTPTEYDLTMNIMGEEFDTKLAVYGTEGNCKAMVSIHMPEEMTHTPGGAFVPYAFVDCTWVDEDTVASVGRTFNVTTGNVLVEVTE